MAVKVFELTTWSDTKIIPIKVEGQFLTPKIQAGELNSGNKKVFLYFPEQEPNEKNLESFALADELKEQNLEKTFEYKQTSPFSIDLSQLVANDPYKLELFKNAQESLKL